MTSAEVLAFRVCEVTGLPHPEYLLPFLSARQLLDWERYSKEAGYRADIQWGMLTALIANQWRGKEDLPVRVETMMPYFDPPPIEPETLRQRLQGILKK